ncbi:MAG: MerR family transcriptional regulator [Planctomycetes bacterium]|nr:MerR family transcriptional regulator [Planctomycetota bacterium]
MTPPTDNLTLDDLCQDATRLLQKNGLLDAQKDGRVTDAPDPRTVRYYQGLNLVDRPRILDREARYGWKQVLQVLAIKALQHIGLPLAQIQNRLIGRSEAELEAVLRGVTERPQPRHPAVKSVTWKEIVIEPGLRLMVEEGWSFATDPDATVARLRAVLAALSASNGGTAHEAR